MEAQKLMGVIKPLIMGLIFMSLFSMTMFTFIGDVNERFGNTQNSTYSQQFTSFSSTKSLVNNISSKAPGGNESNLGSPIGYGLWTGSLTTASAIYEVSTGYKNVLYGENGTGVLQQANIPRPFLDAASIWVILTIVLVLISSILLHVL